MPTQRTKTIGSQVTPARDYLTPALFIAALPANLVTADENWRGECYNDSEFTGVAGGRIYNDVNGHTTDSTHTITITCATGQSWIDDPNVATNPMRYDASKGVGFRKTGGYDYCVAIQNTGYYTVSRLQVKCDDTTHSAAGIYFFNGCDNSNLFDCISHVQSYFALSLYSAGGVMRNCIGYLEGSSGTGMRSGNGSKNIGITLIRNSAVSAAGTAFSTDYPNNDTLVSCCCFGFTTVAGSGFHTTNSKNNGTDQASGFPGTTANVYNITYNGTTPFTDANVSGGYDLTPIAGTGLAGAGFLDATNAPNDIIGVVRSAGPTIGARQIVTAAAASFPPVPQLRPALFDHIMR